MSDFHPEWLADLGPWHAVGDTPFLARCLPSDPDGAILILRPWGPWEEQRWRAVFSPPDRDDDGQDWRHGEIKAPDGRYWPNRESAEDALDAAWSAWRARYRASRGVAPDDGRRHTLLVALTPSLLARIQALGFEVGSEGVLPWLVGKAEEMRAECDAFATYREMTTTALGIEPSSCAEDVAEAVNEMRLTLAAEQGKAEGVPNFSGMEWMDDVKVWRAALLRLVGGRTDHLRAMFGEEIVRAAVAWGDNDSARWDNLSAPEQAHWVADYIERAAMVAADKAIGQPAAEWRRPYRNLIHVLDVIDDRVMLSIPGWRSRWFVERTLDVFAPELRATVARDRYYFGLVNIGAESSDDLAIEVTELAPEPDPDDGPASEAAENAGRPSNVLLTLTPHLKACIEALGYIPGETPAGVLPWLVALAEGQRAILSVPVEGVNLEEVLRLDREATQEPWRSYNAAPFKESIPLLTTDEIRRPMVRYEADERLIVYYRTAAPALAREVQRLRLEVADLRTHHTEALTAAGAPLTDGDGKALSELQRVAYLSDLVDDGKARHLFQRLVERTAAALGLVGERFDPEIGEVCLPSWHDIPEQVEQLVKRSAARKTP